MEDEIGIVEEVEDGTGRDILSPVSCPRALEIWK